MTNETTIEGPAREEEETDSERAERMSDALDADGDWDWTDGAEHAPSDRLAVVEENGGYWLVYDGTEPPEATAYPSRRAAVAAMRDLIAQITGRD